MSAVTYYAGAYDADGNIGQVSGAESLGDAVLSLVWWLDNGFVDWIEVPGPEVGRTHRVEDGVLVERTDTGPTVEEQRASMSLMFDQLIIGLVTEGWISEPDGDGWLAGALPTAVLAVISTLPPEDQFSARARATRPSVIKRTNALVNLLAAAEGKTPEEIDAFFTTYAGV